MKRFSSSIALSLALVLLLGVGSALMACGNVCPAGKCASAASCPAGKCDRAASCSATASTATTGTQVGSTALSPAACCPGQSSTCPSTGCSDKSKCVGDKCKASLNVGSKTSLSTATTKSGAGDVKVTKAVEVKPQTAAPVVSKG
jgi:hypothetical protein